MLTLVLMLLPLTVNAEKPNAIDCAEFNMKLSANGRYCVVAELENSVWHDVSLFERVSQAYYDYAETLEE